MTTVSFSRLPLAWALLAAAPSAFAQTTWYVDVNGSAPGTGTLGDPYTSIQYAIDQSSTLNGDTILVQPGTYPENVSYAGKAITIRSTGGAAVTTIDAGGSGSVVSFINAEGPSSALIDLTLTGGAGSSAFGFVGGGLLIASASPSIRGCVVSGNEAIEGGGAWVEGSPSFEDCTFANNLAGLDPGSGSVTYQAGGGVHLRFSDVTFESCIILENEASRGGGVFARESLVRFDQCEVRDNVVYGGQGFADNARGGGVWVTEESSAEVTECTFDGNVAQGPPTCYAGGLGFEDSTGVVMDSLFTDNRASGEECFLYIGWGGGLYADTSSAMTISQCDFVSNDACYGAGYCGPGEMSNCRFLNNTGTDGGGAQGSSSTTSPALEVTDCVFIGNRGIHGDPSEWYGGGLMGPAVATRCLFLGNSASRGGATYWTDLFDCDLIDNRAFGDFDGAIGSRGGAVANGDATQCRFLYNTCVLSGGFPDSGQIGGAAFNGTFTDCLFQGNRAGYGGAAGNATLIRCRVVHNQAVWGGGLTDGSARDTVFVGNEASEFAGAAFSSDLEYCSITGNSASSGGALFTFPFDESSLSHCAVWGNTPDQIRQLVPGTAMVEWSDVQDGWPGTGNFSGDPLFLNPVGADLHLAAGSPCIDAGNPAEPPDSDGSIADVGAFEFVPDWCPLPGSYCIAKETSTGEWPIIASSGSPTVTGADDFHVTASYVRPGQPAVLFWGAAPAAIPFLGGRLCVQAPQIRTPVQTATNGDVGTLDFFFSQSYFAQQGLGAGTQVCAQYWFRDPGHPDGTNVGLSDGMAFVLCP